MLVKAPGAEKNMACVLVAGGKCKDTFREHCGGTFEPATDPKERKQQKKQNKCKMVTTLQLSSTLYVLLFPSE